MLNHTGGPCSHNGMMDYPRIPITDLHLGIFPDSVEFLFTEYTLTACMTNIQSVHKHARTLNACLWLKVQDG